MILYDLRCSLGHRFEAWFRSGAAYDEAEARGGLACPVCGDPGIEKAPMAPRIAKRSGEEPAAPPTSTLAPDDTTREQLQVLRALRRQIEERCDYVGERFPEEARRIHYGEIDPRPIYGEASDTAARDLREEGITVTRIPWLPRADS